MNNFSLLEATGGGGMGGLGGLFAIIIFIMIGLPVILTIIGFFLYKKKKQTAKVLFIISGVYLLISFGVCGALVG